MARSARADRIGLRNKSVNTNPSEKTTLKKSLSIATAIMMLSVFLSRIIGLVRERVIAGFGGTGTDIDAYVTAFIIPELLNHFLAGGFLSITFIPIFQRYMARSDSGGAWRSFSNLMTIGTCAFCAIIPITMLFTPEIIRLAFGHHITDDPRTFALTVRLTRIILPAQLFFYWGAFFSAVQMARNLFFMPAMSPLCYNAGIIAGGLLFGKSLGVEGFAWGVLAGAFAGNILILLPGAVKAGMRYRVRFDLRDADVKRFLLLSLPLVIGVGMTFSNEILFRFFGSFLGEGGTSSLNYGLRTMMFVAAVFGQASGVAFFPYLSRLAAEKKLSEITSLSDRVLVKIAVYCIPLSFLFAVLAPQIIAILYEHGSFDALSTARTAPVFAIYMAGAFFFAAAVFVARPFYAIQKPHIPMIVSSAILLCTLPLYYVASRRWGGLGIAASAVCGMSLQFALLYGIWHLRSGTERAGKTIKTFGTTVLVSGIAAALGWAVKRELVTLSLGFGSIPDALFVCAATAIPTGLVVFLLYELTGLQRIREIAAAIRKSANPGRKVNT